MRGLRRWLGGHDDEDGAELEDESPAAEADDFRPFAQPASDPEPEPEPPADEEPEAEAEPEPEPEPEPQPTPPAPRQWNVWSIEEALRARGDEQDEETSYLLVYLREFASPDGSLPLDFDGLVRESFADLLEPEPEGVA